MRFFAATVLRNGPVDLLPHWLDYYLRLGLDELILCVLREGMEERLDQINSLIKGKPARVYLFSGWHDDGQPQIRDGLEQYGCRPDDWVIHADLDELNEFPAPINELAEAMARNDRKAVHGHFIDRVDADGCLTALTATPSLAEQYPVECKLTENICRGFTQKIMMCRHEVTVSAGHHTASVPSGKHPIGKWQDYRVHHFKWRDMVLERIKWALSNGAARDGWDQETQRFIDFLQYERIPVEDSRLESKHVGTASPRLFPRTDR